MVHGNLVGVSEVDREVRGPSLFCSFSKVLCTATVYFIIYSLYGNGLFYKGVLLPY